MLELRHTAYTVALACLLAISTAGIAAGAGSTDVILSAENETVEPGTNVTYDVVVRDASGGVGSLNGTFETNDSAVASVSAVSYAGDPAFASQPDGGETVRLAATGMDTLDSGIVRIARVTVQASEPGTAAFSLSVTKLGDESGRAYTVEATRGRTLTVVDDSSPTPTPDDADGIPNEPKTTATATETPTATATEAENHETATTAQTTTTTTVTTTDTPSPTDRSTPSETQTAVPTASTPTTEAGGGARSPTDPSQPRQPPVAILAVVVLAALALVAYLYAR